MGEISSLALKGRKTNALSLSVSFVGVTEASVSLGVAGLGLAGRIGIGRYSRVV